MDIDSIQGACKKQRLVLLKINGEVAGTIVEGH